MTEPKRGLLVINSPLPPPYGGVATYLSFALPYLAQNGFEVYGVLDKEPPNPTVYKSFENAGVHLHYGVQGKVNKIIQIVRHFSFWVTLYKRSKLPLGAFLNVMKSMVVWLGASEAILQKYSIDVIHAYDYPWVQGYVASYLAAKYGKKYVQTTFGEVVPHRHELVRHDTMGEKYKNFVCSVLDSCDVIISVSKHCAREVTHVGVDASRVKISYHGVDSDVFSAAADGTTIRRQYQLQDNPVVLFLGQMRPRKGPQVLLEAVPSVLKTVPNATFIFVGPDYDITGTMKRRAEELGVARNVHFTGSIPDDELREFYAACDVFAFPSLTPIECLGLSMIQAMACGKPVVASRINGAPEVVVEDETGFLVEPNNPAQLAEKISTLLANPERRTSMGENGMRRAHAMFNQKNLAEELRQIYLSIIE